MKRLAATASDDSEKYGQGAVDAGHHLVIERADAGTNGVMRNGHNLIDHNLRRLLEAILRRGLNGKAKQGRIKKLGRQEQIVTFPSAEKRSDCRTRAGLGFPL